MAYFEDLSEYRYFGEPESGVLNVGWLEKGQPFHTGETSEGFQTALNDLCIDKSIRHCLGHHVCEFCPDASWHDPYFHSMETVKSDCVMLTAFGMWRLGWLFTMSKSTAIVRLKAFYQQY